MSAAHILRVLRKREQSLACVESCTGGLLGASFVSCTGASQVFVGSANVYQHYAKNTLFHRTGIDFHLKTGDDALTTYCVEAMLQAGKHFFGADLVIATSGLAPSEGEKVSHASNILGLAQGDVLFGVLYQGNLEMDCISVQCARRDHFMPSTVDAILSRVASMCAKSSSLV